MRRAMMGRRKKLVLKRFYPGGNYTWTVPDGVYEVDVFLVGGGGGAQSYTFRYKGGGGGGYTKTYKRSTEGWRDGDAIKVTPGEKIKIRVGYGQRSGYGQGGESWFKSTTYRAAGGYAGTPTESKYGSNGGNGGSGGGDWSNPGGSDGGSAGGSGQGHTTRDFGEPTGKRNAGGGGGQYEKGGESDYSEGSGGNGGTNGGRGGGGYGGGAGASNDSGWVNGGDGTVLIRYWTYE